MKSFIKAAVVATVLVAASTSFASLNKAGTTGTGGVSCAGKVNNMLFANTADTQKAASSTATNTKTVGGKIVR